MVLRELTGVVLAQAIEHSVDARPRPSGHLLQAAGLTFSVDVAQPVGGRVSGIRVGGRPLDPGRRYRAAVPDFLARGQDDYTMLAASARVRLLPEDGPGLIDTVFQALARGRSP